MGHDGTTHKQETGLGTVFVLPPITTAAKSGYSSLAQQPAPGDLGSSGQQLLTKRASRDPLKGHRIGAYQGQRLTTPDDVR